MTTAVTEVGRPEEGHGHRHLGIALIIISIAQLMVVLDSTIVNIAIPYISSDLQFNQANKPWIVTGYTLAFGGLLLLGGRLGDLLGRRKVFMAGVLIFSVASFLGGIAQSESMLLSARALQGLGAAIASPTALALITTTFPPGKPRNRAFAVYAAMSGAGAAVGLILGGWLTEYSWRWTFLINVPIGIAAACAAPYFLGESARRRGSFDIPGAITGTLGLISVVYGLTHAAQLKLDPTKHHAWTDPVTLTALLGGAALLIAFVLIERSVREPLMPFRILANRTRGVSFAVMLLMMAAMFAMFFFLSQVIQNVMGYSSLKAGLAFLPFSLGIVVSAGLASSLASKVNPRWLAGSGTILTGLGMWGFSRIPYADNVASPSSFGVHASYVTDLLPWILVMSIGMGFVFVPLTLTAVHGVAANDSGVGSGVLNAMQQVGGSLGLATLTTVFVTALNNTATDLGAAAASVAAKTGGRSPTEQHALAHQISNVAFTHGAEMAFLVGAIMTWFGAVLVLAFLRVKHQELAADGTPDAVIDEVAEPVPVG
ncbi:MAG: MFS transporter [Nocardioidaceae bacterium]